MTAFDVTTAAQVAVNPGICDFIHIYNNSDEVIYVSYDGTLVTVAEGIPLYPQVTFQFGNDGAKPIFTRGISLIHAGTGSKEVRIQQG